MANPAHPRWRDWRKYVGENGEKYIDANSLVKPAFATPSFPISGIGAFHTDRDSEFANAEIDLMPEAFGIERSLSTKGCPLRQRRRRVDQQEAEGEHVHRETFGTTRELRAKFSDYAHRYNKFRIHSTLGYMSPVEFRKGAVPPRIVQISVTNPTRDLMGIAVPTE